jgi:hypothetical protein
LAPDRIARAVFLATALLAALPVVAGEASVEVPMRDPWVPPQLAKQARVEAGSSGVALGEEVDRKLRARFAAAAGADGDLTRDGARAAGLGFIERHFDAIDRVHAGRITYEDYRRFLVERGAALP